MDPTPLSGHQWAPPHPQQSIVLHTVGGPAFGIRLKCQVGGQPVPIDQVDTVIPVAPGTHRLELEARSRATFGEVALDVRVPPNHHIRVFYAVPWTYYSRGMIGFVPQRRSLAPDWAGIGWALGGLAIFFGIALLIAFLTGNLG